MATKRERPWGWRGNAGRKNGGTKGNRDRNIQPFVATSGTTRWPYQQQNWDFWWKWRDNFPYGHGDF